MQEYLGKWLITHYNGKYSAWEITSIDELQVYQHAMGGVATEYLDRNVGDTELDAWQKCRLQAKKTLERATEIMGVIDEKIHDVKKAILKVNRERITKNSERVDKYTRMAVHPIINEVITDLCKGRCIPKNNMLKKTSCIYR